MRHFIFLALLLKMSGFVPAQNQDEIKITGSVFNAETKKPLGFVQLVSFETFLSYASDKDGNFLIYLPPSDSIKIVSMGFEGVVMKVQDFLKTPGRDSIYLEPATYMLREVTINANEKEINLHLPGNFGINVDPDAEPDKSLPKPSIGMVMSPLTLAHSVLSKEARAQRRSQKNIQSHQKLSLWGEVLSSGMIKDWVDIEDQQLEDFIIFCNQHMKISETDNLLSLRNKVIHQWKTFNEKKQKN